MRYKIRGEVCEFQTGPFGRIPSVVDIADALDKDGDDVILLDIHSGGGDVEAEIYLLNALQRARRHGKKIVTYCPGFCASAAADLLFQGDEIFLGDVSFVMVHNGFAGYPSLLSLVLTKLSRVVEWWKGGCVPLKANLIDFFNAHLAGFIPFEELLSAYGEKGRQPNGDYCFTAQDLAGLFPAVVSVDDLPKEYEMLSFFELDEDIDGIIGEIENGLIIDEDEDTKGGEKEEVQPAGDE
jgi:hypothetical protein